jgi:threonylcarbamoyladenosine tRNA methylthiotransferase MtaB
MNQFKKVAFYTLGCKLNFSETSTLARLFEEGGYAKVDFEENPDVFIINTCSVTENADKKCKQLVKRAQKINSEALIAIVGCYAQLKPEEIGKIPGVDIVLGANEKFNVLDHLDKLETKPGKSIIKYDSIKKTTEFVPSFSYGDRTRSFLKVQDGCDYFCTFCTIPLARGKSRNATIEQTVEEANKIAKTEVKEIVLTGVNIGDFGQGSRENFYELVRALDKVDGIDRFRISSIEPNLLSNEIIDFCLNKSQRFVPHFHIPLQSGSNAMLKAMRRKYERELYAERVETIKKNNPDCCIGVDVIVGFPGESDEEFSKTVEFLKELDISYLHVFTYSERANTTAIKMGDSVPIEKRRERSKILHLLSDRKKRNFYEQNLGKTRIALIESEQDEGWMYGFTDNYVKVRIPFDLSLANKLVEVKLTKVNSDDSMDCEIVNK